MFHSQVLSQARPLSVTLLLEFFFFWTRFSISLEDSGVIVLPVWIQPERFEA